MPQRPDYETDRLRVTPWTTASKTLDQNDQLASLLTKNVLKHLPEPLQFDPNSQTIDEWIDARTAESEVMVISVRDKPKLVGLLILATFEEKAHPLQIHLGYLLAEDAWGKGYGTELIAGLVAHYRALGKNTDLMGGVEKENIASAKVLQKAGFVPDETASTETTVMFKLSIRPQR